jgi:hypothetical protein
MTISKLSQHLISGDVLIGRLREDSHSYLDYALTVILEPQQKPDSALNTTLKAFVSVLLVLLKGPLGSGSGRHGGVYRPDNIKPLTCRRPRVRGPPQTLTG